MRRRTIGFELENLHDCAAGERVDNSSSGGLNNNRCLTHPLPRETLDLFPKLVTGNSKQRPVVLLNLCGPSLGASASRYMAGVIAGKGVTCPTHSSCDVRKRIRGGSMREGASATPTSFSSSRTRCAKDDSRISV